MIGLPLRPVSGGPGEATGDELRCSILDLDMTLITTSAASLDQQ